ncbi:acyltransferase [Clostridium algoriphilum]|uniref:acyltransferase family protein n=1 Tax=Clostridium algoriphilum TaxID=198347 RepID=UPI001CF4BB98|nr:acyltransferase [Clostridium algoriphilum]MCB2295312.1 acyltransferase [Clostridium algoriphilum]
MDIKKNIKLDSIQIMRGIGAILIILFHSTTLYQIKFNISYLNGIFKFGFIGVDLFFIVSGFILLYTRKKESVGKYLVKRFVRIYPLYWVILSCVIILMFIIPNAGNGGQKNIVFLLKNIFLIPDKSLFMIPQAWTLSYEILFYLMFLTTMASNKKIAKIVIELWTVGCLVNTIGNFNNANLFIKVMFNPVNLEFLIGGMIYFLIIKYKESITRKICNISIVVGLMLTCFFATLIYFDKPYLSRILIGLSLALIIFGVIVKNIKYECKYNKFLIYIGNASYSIYLTHFTLISATIIILQKTNIKCINSFTITLVDIVIVACGCICHNVLEKPIGKYFKNLFKKADKLKDIMIKQ